MRKTCLTIMIAVALLSMGLSGCNPAEKNTDGGVQIVTTTGMISDILNQLLPPEITAKALMGPGIDPHLYKPTFRDIEQLEAADVIVFNGLHLEGKMQEILEHQGKTNPVYAVAQFTDSSMWIPLNEDSLLFDPHIWFQPKAFVQACSEIALSVCRNGQDSSIALQRKDHYFRKLESLLDSLQANINALPEEKRIMVTAHDAFSYFGSFFGIEVNALQGVNTSAEYGVKDVRELVDFIEQKQVPCIFLESSISERSMQAVRREAQRRNLPLNIGDALYSDAMGPANSRASNYLGMIAYNVETFLTGMQSENKP